MPSAFGSVGARAERARDDCQLQDEWDVREVRFACILFEGWTRREVRDTILGFLWVFGAGSVLSDGVLYCESKEMLPIGSNINWYF